MSRSYFIERLGRLGIIAALCAVFAGTARADNYSDTIALFRNSGQSSAFFARSYAYAVFPTIGKGGFVVGGAHGKGRVYAQARNSRTHRAEANRSRPLPAGAARRRMRLAGPLGRRGSFNEARSDRTWKRVSVAGAPCPD
jgi:hypothetical protein